MGSAGRPMSSQPETSGDNSVINPYKQNMYNSAFKPKAIPEEENDF